jgi:hypothetical protein
MLFRCCGCTSFAPVVNEKPTPESMPRLLPHGPLNPFHWLCQQLKTPATFTRCWFIVGAGMKQVDADLLASADTNKPSQNRGVIISRRRRQLTESRAAVAVAAVEPEKKRLNKLLPAHFARFAPRAAAALEGPIASANHQSAAQCFLGLQTQTSIVDGIRRGVAAGSHNHAVTRY